MYHTIYLRFNMHSHVAPYTLNELENLWTHREVSATWHSAAMAQSSTATSST